MSDETKALLEEAMHELLHVDASMNDRIEVAKKVATAIGHRWPPYEVCEGCDDPATKADVDGVALCLNCYDDCVAEDPGPSS